MKRIGHRYRDSDTLETIDVWYPKSNRKIKRHCLAQQVGLIEGDFVEVEIADYSEPPVSTEDAYLRLHLLSECKVRPNQIKGTSKNYLT